MTARLWNISRTEDEDVVSGKSDLIEVAGILRHETERAYLVDAGTGDPVWLPKSMVEHDESDGVFVMPEWLAIEKGLV